jgi:hypothetical protein
MTERERWIIYPLLFLALGSALRDKLIDQTRSKSIVCQELIVFGEDRGRRQMVPLVRIGAAESPGQGTRPFGAVEVDGVVKAELVQAANFSFRGIPFGPTILQAVPGMLPADWLKALQQSAEAMKRGGAAPGEPQGRIVPLSPESAAPSTVRDNSAPDSDANDGSAEN